MAKGKGLGMLLKIRIAEFILKYTPRRFTILLVKYLRNLMLLKYKEDCILYNELNAWLGITTKRKEN
jgi:hypothetical protein